MGFSTLGEDDAWGGSQLTLNCAPTVLLAWWQRLRQDLPAVWLHDAECRMYRPESFLKLCDAGEVKSG